MAEGITQIYLLDSNGFTVEVSVTETYDILKNTSDVSVGLRVKSAYKLGVQYFSGSIKLDGETLLVMNSTISTHNILFSSYNTWYKVVRSSDRYTDSPWIKENIAHDADGGKDLNLELEMRGYGLDGYLGLRVATTKTISLTKIPRASTVAAADANIGSVATVSVIRCVPDYTHSIAYQFGTLSGYLCRDGSVSTQETKLTETSIPFLLPESFYDQIPDNPSGECTLTARTYMGDQQIGEVQTTTFTVTAAKRVCQPLIFGRVEDINDATIALTADPNILVRYASDALCTMTAEGQKGARILSKTIAGQNVEENTLLLPAVDTDTVNFRCTDSRGYTASVDVKQELVPYIHLSADFTVKRTDPTSGNGILELSGDWFNGSFGAEENHLTAAYTVNGGQPVSITVTTEGNTYQGTATVKNLDYLRSHTIAVTVSDSLQTVTKSASVGKGIPVFDWDEDDFQFHVPVSLEANRLMDLADPALDTDGVNLKTMHAALNEKAPAGYGFGGAPVSIGSGNLTCESALETALDSVYNVMNSGETKLIRFRGYPSDSDHDWFGLLSKASDNYGSLIVHSAYDANSVYIKARQNGKWKPIVPAGSSRVKLWENASLGSTFDKQKIALDLSDYDGVEVVTFGDQTTGVYLNSGFIRKGLQGVFQYMYATQAYRLTRTFTVDDTGVDFATATNTGTLAVNKLAKPFIIYGIKGVVE